MKKSLLLLFAVPVLTACRTSPLPAPTASPSVAAGEAATANLPTPTGVAEIPYPYPYTAEAYPPSRPEYPTIDPFETNLPDPTVTPTPLDLSRVRIAKLLNAQQGWILSNGGLLWTEDAGQQWRQMTPPGIGVEIIRKVFFLDRNHAWVLSCDPQASEDRDKLFHTSNGGETWELKEITVVQEVTKDVHVSCSRGYDFFFLNAQQGWMVVYTAIWRTYVGEMFQTLDGGQTWQHLGTTPHGEFFFISDTDGWMLAYSYGPKPLYRTQDGGQTWQRSVSMNGSDKYNDFFLPVFTDQQTGILAVILRDENGTTDGVTFFKTLDGGLTWIPIGNLSSLPPEGLGYGSNSVQIWDDQTWVVTVPNFGIYWTLDGGQSWVANTTETAHRIYGITLSSSTSGWGLQFKCDHGAVLKCLYLVATADMGAHWEDVPINP